MNKYFAFTPITKLDSCIHGFCDAKAEYMFFKPEFHELQQNQVTLHSHLLCEAHLIIYKDYYESQNFNNVTLKYFTKFYQKFIVDKSDFKKILLKLKINAYLSCNQKNS